jgi:DNA-binding PadR family transcriptional regulator
MPVHHAVLGLLTEGPSYGYELKARFSEAVGPQWGEINIGHIYQVLDRLERDGFVTGSRVRQKERPDKTVFRLTKPGRLELDAWLSRPFIGRGGFRDDFFLKLFVASRLGPDRLREVARTQREVYLAELATLGNLRRQHREEPLVSLLIKAAVLQTEANLKVVEDADDQAERLAMAAEGARATQLTQDATGETAASAHQ